MAPITVQVNTVGEQVAIIQTLNGVQGSVQYEPPSSVARFRMTSGDCNYVVAPAHTKTWGDVVTCGCSCLTQVC